MLASIINLIILICNKLNSISNVLGGIAFLFNINKIYSFMASFFYMPKARLKAITTRFSLSVDEMRIINEFLSHDFKDPFLFFNEAKKNRRIDHFPGAGVYRLPTVKERTALIALQNKGLIVQRRPFEKFSGKEEIDRDVYLADSIVTDLFKMTFTSYI